MLWESWLLSQLMVSELVCCFVSLKLYFDFNIFRTRHVQMVLVFPYIFLLIKPCLVSGIYGIVGANSSHAKVVMTMLHSNPIIIIVESSSVILCKVKPFSAIIQFLSLWQKVILANSVTLVLHCGGCKLLVSLGSAI